MRLVSPYAPTSYRTPCLVVSTVWNSVTRETAVKFVTALNANHALAFGGDHAPPSTDWIVLKRHDSREAAEQYHLALARQFINGATEAEWEAGMDAYRRLRNDCHAS